MDIQKVADRVLDATGLTPISTQTPLEHSSIAPESPKFSPFGDDFPFDKLSYEFRTLGCPVIEKIHASELTPLVFYRDFVSKNIPVVIEGAVDHWPALRRWRSDAYLRQVVGHEEVTIDFTPDGRGDSIVDGKMFVTPCEEKMRFGDFLSLVKRETDQSAPSPLPSGFEGNMPSNAFVDDREVTLSDLAKIDPGAVNVTSRAFVPESAESVVEKHPGIPYCQHQNSSFNTEFEALHKDAELDLGFATEALGCKPDAVNFWMGDTRSVTTMHSDNYENLYVVVCGEKHFTLCPPADYYWIPKSTLPLGAWQRDSNSDSESKNSTYVAPETCDQDNQSSQETKTSSSSCIDKRDALSPLCVRRPGFIAYPHDRQDPHSTVTPWINIDVDNPTQEDAERGVAFDKISKFNVTVSAGQVLYLPSLWFHAVRQRGRTIAVNYWYDMAYDGRYVMHNFMTAVADKYLDEEQTRQQEREQRSQRVYEIRDNYEKAHGIVRKTIEEEIEEDRLAAEQAARERRHARGIYSDSEDDQDEQEEVKSPEAGQKD